MKNLSVYNDAFIAKMNEQLAVYTTIGEAKLESPMWFQYAEHDEQNNVLRFKSSQVSYMYFSIDLLPEHKDLPFDNFQEVYDHFKQLKYAHIKANWPTVYFELRPEEKPVIIPESIEQAPKQEDEPDNYEQQAIDFLTATSTTFKAEFIEFAPYFDDEKESRNVFKITLQNSRHKFSFRFGSSLNDSCKEVLRPIIDSDEETSIFYGFKHGSHRTQFVTFGHSIKTSYAVLRKIFNDEIRAESLINEDALNKDFLEYQAKVEEFNKKSGRGNGINGRRLDDIRNDVLVKINVALTDATKKTERVLIGQKDEIITPTAYSVLAGLTKYNPGNFKNFCDEFGYNEDSRKAFKTYKAVMREWKNIELLFTPEQIDQLQEIN